MSEKSAERYDGIGMGVGLLLGAALCLALPSLLDLSTGWQAAGRVTAWVLGTFGAAASLFEIEKVSQLKGFDDVGAAVVLFGAGSGLLALGYKVFHGALAGVTGVSGVVCLVVGLVGLGMGVAKLIGHAVPSAGVAPSSTTTATGATTQSQAGLTRAEKWGLGLAAAQVVLGAIALVAA